MYHYIRKKLILKIQLSQTGIRKPINYILPGQCFSRFSINPHFLNIQKNHKARV